MRASEAWKKHETIKEAREALEKDPRKVVTKASVSFAPMYMAGASHDARVVVAEAMAKVFADQFDAIALRTLESIRKHERESLAEAVAATTDEVSR